MNYRVVEHPGVKIRHDYDLSVYICKGDSMDDLTDDQLLNMDHVDNIHYCGIIHLAPGICLRVQEDRIDFIPEEHI